MKDFETEREMKLDAEANKLADQVENAEKAYGDLIDELSKVEEENANLRLELDRLSRQPTEGMKVMDRGYWCETYRELMDLQPQRGWDKCKCCKLSPCNSPVTILTANGEGR